MNALHVSLAELSKEHFPPGDIFAFDGSGNVVRILKSARLLDFYEANAPARVMPSSLFVSVPNLEKSSCDAVRARLIELGIDESRFDQY